MNCADFLAAMREDPLAGWQCVPDEGFVRIRTPLRYSDGGIVELYVEERGDHVIITDFGESFRFLQSHGLHPLRSAVRRQIVDLALELGKATAVEDAIEIRIIDRRQLPEALLRLGQVVTRVADLALTAKGSLVATFPDAVEDYLRINLPDAELTRNGEVAGRATTHTFDLVIHSMRGITALSALSAVSTNGASAQTAFTIRKLADIAALGRAAPDRITVIDDSSEVWSESLRAELANYSEVFDWDRRDDLVLRLTRPR